MFATTQETHFLAPSMTPSPHVCKNLELDYHVELAPFSLERDLGDMPMLSAVEAWADCLWAQGKYNLLKELCLGVEIGIHSEWPHQFFSFWKRPRIGGIDCQS